MAGRIHRPYGTFRLVRSCRSRSPRTAADAVGWGTRPPPAVIALSTITLVTAAGPLPLEIGADTLLTECRGPAGEAGATAAEAVTRALSAGGHGPPLAAHVVPGDRVTIALAGELPQAGAVLESLVACLAAGGVAAADTTVLQAMPLDATRRLAPPPSATIFDPGFETGTSYLAADAAGRPMCLARALVDADVVVAVGGFGWDASVAGRSLEGELWPAFARTEDREALVADIARRGRAALVDWRHTLHDITWQLGVCASLRLVAGADGTLHAARFGLPEEAATLARAAAAGWRPSVGEPADLVVATLSAGAGGFGDVVRAAAAASRVARPDAVVVVVAADVAPPGVVLTRWRQGTPLGPLVREAAGSGDAALVADAVQTRLLARRLGERRLVLLSALEEAQVEELGFGHAADVGVIERLADRAERVAILHEADRMLPGP